MADSAAAGCIKINLLGLAPKVINFAKRQNLESPDVKSLLSLRDEGHGDGEEDVHVLTAGTRFISSPYVRFYMISFLF